VRDARGLSIGEAARFAFSGVDLAVTSGRRANAASVRVAGRDESCCVRRS
jgi:hypothetical protein